MKGMKRLIAAGLSAILTLAMLPVGAGTTIVQAATTKATTISNPYVEKGKVVYDCVYFGNYWQKDTNGDGEANKQDKKSPIKWRVLSVDGSKALLVADQVLDCQSYNDTYTSITWADCTMRTWLDGTFKNDAFTSSEQKAIQATAITNKDNQYYGTAGGVNTKDSVFLLSLEDMANTKYGFSNFDLTNWNGNEIGEIDGYPIYDYAKLRTVTAFASGSDTATGDSYVSSIGTNWWWLRSPGIRSDIASDVNDYGYVGDYGYYVDYYYFGVVPALYLNLSSTANYTYAGTVSCDGNGIAYNEKATGNGGSGSYTIGATAEPVAISKTKTSLVAGKALTLKVNGTTATVKWTSSDSKIAKVDSKGKVTAIKAGKATITAKVDGKKYNCVVTVTEPVKLSKTKASLAVGKTVTLKMTGTTATVKWTSSNSKIAKVNSKGKVTAVKAGKATITATVGGKKYNCVVTVTK